MKRVVVAFDEEGIKYAKKHGLNKALAQAQIHLIDVREYEFKTIEEANGFLFGVREANFLDEPFGKITRKVKPFKKASV